MRGRPVAAVCWGALGKVLVFIQKGASGGALNRALLQGYPIVSGGPPTNSAGEQRAGRAAAARRKR